MSKPAVPTISFGRALGEAARETDALHQRILAAAEIEFSRWVTFNYLDGAGGSMRRSALVERLSGPLRLESTGVDDLLAGFVADGDIADDGHHGFSLTTQGAQRFVAARDRAAAVEV